MDNANVFKSSFNRDNLYYEVRPKTKDVAKDIIKFIKQHPDRSGVVYCLSRKKVEEIAETLVVNGSSLATAGLDAATRAKHQDMFLMEDADVIVATIAFGMGIDKPDVRFGFTTRFLPTSKVTIRKLVVPEETVVKEIALPSTATMIFRSWRNS